jgi:hypothetical protein
VKNIEDLVVQRELRFLQEASYKTGHDHVHDLGDEDKKNEDQNGLQITVGSDFRERIQ